MRRRPPLTPPPLPDMPQTFHLGPPSSLSLAFKVKSRCWQHLATAQISRRKVSFNWFGGPSSTTSPLFGNKVQIFPPPNIDLRVHGDRGVAPPPHTPPLATIP